MKSVLWHALTYFVAGTLGALLGALFNVFIHRVPVCGDSVDFHRKVVGLSYFSTGEVCREGDAHFSTHYPVVECLTALLWIALLVWQGGLTVVLPFDLLFVSAISALIFIDAEHMILPNAITYPGILLAFLARILVPHLAGPAHFDDLPQLLTFFPGLPVWVVSLIGAAIGALAGGGSLWLMGFLWEKLRGVEAMGFGDVKMMFMVGAFLGWRLTILTILLGAFTGSIAGVIVMLRRGSRNLQMMLPFGIFLGIGSIVSLLLGSRIIAWYASQFR